MWAALLSLLGIGGGGIARAIGDIIGDLTDARVRLANAKTEQERIAAQADVDKHKAELASVDETKRDPLLRLVQFALGLIVVSYAFKVITWDYVLGLGVTGELRGNTWIIYLSSLGLFVLVRK